MEGASGPVAVSHSEIRAWALNTGTEFADDEAEILHTLSTEYAQELRQAAKGRAPYTAPKSSR